MPDAVVAAADAENGVASAVVGHKADAAAASAVAAADDACDAEEWLVASELVLAAVEAQVAVAVVADEAAVHTSGAEEAAKTAAVDVVVEDSVLVSADGDEVKKTGIDLPFVTCWPSGKEVAACEERVHHFDDQQDQHKETEDRVTGSASSAVVSCHDTYSKYEKELADFVPAGDKHRSVLSSVRSVAD